MAFGEPAALVDGNVHRVLCRLFAVTEEAAAARKTCWVIAESIVPADRPGDFNQALMELGATVCTPSNPSCKTCPVRSACDAHGQGIVAEVPRSPKKKRPSEEKRVALLIERQGRRSLGRGGHGCRHA